MIKLGDCFSGIGGNSIGFQFVFGGGGFGGDDGDGQIVWGSELNHNKYGRYLESLSKRHFPNKKNLGDITKIQNPPEVDIIDGGFPCQDISQVNCQGTSGTSGIKSNLYTEQLRLAKECNPAYIHFENSWMISKKGLNNVLYDLYQMGYHVQWKTLPLYAFGLPHGRMRTYIIAYKENGTLNDIFDSPNNFTKRYGFKFDMFFSPAEMTFDTSEFMKPQPLLVETTTEIQYRLNALGNSVHTTASIYVHDAIKRHYNALTTKIDSEHIGHIKDFRINEKTYHEMPMSGMMVKGELYKTETKKYKKPKLTIPTPVKTQSSGWEDAFCWAKYNSKARVNIGKTSLISQDPTLLFKKWYLLNMGIDRVKDINEFKKKIEPKLPKLIVNPNLIELLMGFPIDWTKP